MENTNEIERLLAAFPEHFVCIVGDFNSNLSLPAPKSQVVTCRSVFGSLLDRPHKPFRIISPTTKGHFSRESYDAKRVRSNIDFILTDGTAEVVRNASATSAYSDFTSDHKLLTSAITLVALPQKKKPSAQPKWNLKKLESQQCRDLLIASFRPLAKAILSNLTPTATTRREARQVRPQGAWTLLVEGIRKAGKKSIGMNEGSICKPFFPSIPRELSDALYDEDTHTASLVRRILYNHLNTKGAVPAGQEIVLEEQLRHFRNSVWFAHVNAKDKSKLWKLVQHLKNQKKRIATKTSQLTALESYNAHREKVAKCHQVAQGAESWVVHVELISKIITNQHRLQVRWSHLVPRGTHEQHRCGSELCVRSEVSTLSTRKVAGGLTP